MIEMVVRIEDTIEPVANEFGTGVHVFTKLDKNPSDTEGATFVGICLAINDYMRSRGCPDFNCMKELKLNG